MASADDTFAFPNGVNVTGSVTTGTPSVQTTTLCTGAACAVFLPAFNVNDTMTGNGAVGAGFFEKSITLTYSSVPEPTTMALTGVALLAAGWAKRRGRADLSSIR